MVVAEVELGQRPRTCAYSRLMAPYPSIARVSWRFRGTTDGECIGTGTPRNRRSNGFKVVETTNDKVSPVRQSGQGVLPPCWLESASNLIMSALRALPIKSTLEQGSTAIHIGFRLISRRDLARFLFMLFFLAPRC